MSVNILPTTSTNDFPLDEYHFQQLHREYQQQLLSLATKWTGCPHDAQDVLIDVFTKLWIQRRDLKVHSNLGAYLRSAVHNRSIDYLRRRNRRRNVCHELPMQKPCSEPDLHERVVAGETAIRINKAVAALPPRGQEIFRLNRFEGLTYQQIAEQLGLSYKTVETHMRRNLIALRNRLRPQIA